MYSTEDLDKLFPRILKRVGEIADQAGMKVYAVGGYIRDLLMCGNSVHRDIDLTVTGDSVVLARKLKKKLGARILVTYERFGTSMLQVQGYKLELVTARKEKYLPGSRKPLIKKAGPEADLARRDFTINALAVGLNKDNWGKLFDNFHGLDDLQRGIIRTPLEPQTTFADDPLRILRAIRFSTVLDFDLEKGTREAIQNMAPRLQIISEERVSEELLKMIDAQRPSRGFLLMDSLGLLPFVLPELTEMKGAEQRKEFHHKDIFEHTLQVLDNVAAVSKKKELRLAALFHDVGKPSTKKFDPEQGWTFHHHDEAGARIMEKIARRLRLSKSVKNYIQKLIRLHLRPIFLVSGEVTDSAVRRLIVQAGDELPDLFQLCRADITSGNPSRVRLQLRNLDQLERRVAQVQEKDKLRNFQSPVRGEKIMQVCAIPPGPLVGKLKMEIEEAILDGKIPNDYQAALDYLDQIKDKYLQEI